MVKLVAAIVLIGLVYGAWLAGMLSVLRRPRNVTDLAAWKRKKGLRAVRSVRYYDEATGRRTR